MSNPVHIVLDDTAMVAAGRGTILASRLIHRSHAEPGRFLYATACGLVEAGRIAAPDGIIFLDLDLPAVLALTQEATWSAAHTLHAAQPSPDRPDGAVIATTTPETWKGHPVRTLDLTP